MKKQVEIVVGTPKYRQEYFGKILLKFKKGKEVPEKDLILATRYFFAFHQCICAGMVKIKEKK